MTTHARTVRLVLVLVLALLLARPAGTDAQPVTTAAPAGVVTTLEGQALLARAAATPVALKFRDSLFLRDRIETRENTIVRVLLRGKALVTIRELSVFTISEEPGRARVELAQGRAAVGVAKRLLQPGEAIEIHTPNAVAAVRGSEVVVEVLTVGGMLQSVISALEVSAPVTVAPLSNPAATVTLGVNETVSVIGLATAPTITAVRALSTAQVETARRALQAPKPREQSNRPPERITQRVSAERTQEAAQLADVVASGGAAPVMVAPFSRAMTSELDAATQTFQSTQEVFDVTSRRLDEIFEATEALLQRAFGGRLLAGVKFTDTDLTLGPTGGVTFTGAESLPFDPIYDIFGSRVRQAGPGDVFAVAPGSTVAFEGSLLFLGNSSVLSTEGRLFSVGSNATFSAGFGGNGVVSIGSGRTAADPTVVSTGGSLIAIGSGADVTLERPLLAISHDTAVTAGVGSAERVPLIDIGPRARVRTLQALDLFEVRGGVTASGSLLSLGADASLEITTDAGGFVAIGFPRESDLGLSGAAITTGAELLRLGPRARLTTNQPLIGSIGGDLTIGTDMIRLESDASVVTTLPNLVNILAFTPKTSDTQFPSHVIIGRHMLSIAPGAAVISETDLSVELIRITDSSVSIGGDMVFISSRGTLRLGPHELLSARDASLEAIGSLLTIEKDAVFSLVGRLEVPVLLLSRGSIAVGNDMVSLAPGAAVEFERPLFKASNTSVVGGRGLLALGAGASLTVPDLTTIGLIFFSGGSASFHGDVVSVADGARVELNRPLLQPWNGVTFATEGSVLALGRNASLTSGGASRSFGLIDPFDAAIVVGRDMLSLGPGSVVAVDRPLFAPFDSSTVGQRGILALGQGASVTSLTAPDLTNRGLIFFLGGSASFGSDVVSLAEGARVELNRPLLQSQDGATVATEGNLLALGRNASLTSGGASTVLALIDVADGPTRAGAPAVTLESGARLVLDRPLLRSFDSDLTMPAGVLRVGAGGQVVVSSTPDFFVGLDGGTHAIGTAAGASVFDLAGAATAVDAESGLTVGTDRPLQYAGPLLLTFGATLSTGTVVRLDTALLEATLPLVDLRHGSTVTTGADVVDLTARAKLSGVGPLVKLDASSLSVLAGALVNVAGGSFLKVAGDLLDLRNGSTLSLLNGPLLSVSGGSAVNISGGLVSFGGTGGNHVNVANTLCPCTTLSGVPVSFQNGASLANVSIGPNPIRNGGLGTLGLASPNAAAIVVSGPTTRVTIGAP